MSDLVYNEFEKIKNFINEYLTIQSNKNTFLNETNINVKYSFPKNFFSNENVAHVLTKIIKKDGGKVETLECKYILTYENYDKVKIIIEKDGESSFVFSIKHNNIDFFVPNNNNFYVFLHLITNPDLIDEINFHYSITNNGENYRYLTKESAIFNFKNMCNLAFANQNITNYNLDIIHTIGKLENEDGCILLNNPYESDDTKLKYNFTVNEIVLDIPLENKEEYDTLGFSFEEENKKGNHIMTLKMVAEELGYMVSRVGTNQITLLNGNETNIDINISSLYDENKSYDILDIPFNVKVKTLYDRPILVHPSFLEKKYEKPLYSLNQYSFEQICKIIKELLINKIDTGYTVIFNNKLDKNEYSAIHYYSFEDALYYEDAFLSKISNFDIVALDTKSKFGYAYKNIDVKGKPSIYCVVGTAYKISEFHANMCKNKYIL